MHKMDNFSVTNTVVQPLFMCKRMVCPDLATLANLKMPYTQSYLAKKVNKCNFSEIQYMLANMLAHYNKKTFMELKTKLAKIRPAILELLNHF